MSAGLYFEVVVVLKLKSSKGILVQNYYFLHTVVNYANLVLDAKFPHIYVKYIANSICIVFIYKYMSGLEYSS